MKRGGGFPKGKVSIYLPGQLAGASLKHAPALTGPAEAQDLPGQLAGASLKQKCRIVM